MHLERFTRICYFINLYIIIIYCKIGSVNSVLIDDVHYRYKIKKLRFILHRWYINFDQYNVLKSPFRQYSYHVAAIWHNHWYIVKSSYHRTNMVLHIYQIWNWFYSKTHKNIFLSVSIYCHDALNRYTSKDFSLVSIVTIS